jgi:hypothetical protein
MALAACAAVLTADAVLVCMSWQLIGCVAYSFQLGFAFGVMNIVVVAMCLVVPAITVAGGFFIWQNDMKDK